MYHKVLPGIVIPSRTERELQMASRPMLALPIIHKLGPNLYLWTTHPYQPQTRALRVAWSFVFLHTCVHIYR